MKILTGLCVFLLASRCSSGRDATPYSVALEALCGLPEIRSSQVVEVIGQPVAVAQLPALWAHFNAGALTERDVVALTEAEQKFQRGVHSERFRLPEGACIWLVAEDRESYSDLVRIELSPILPKGVVSNPSPGIFARVSAGGRPGADFYWLPVIARGRLGTPVKLSVDDG